MSSLVICNLNVKVKERQINLQNNFSNRGRPALSNAFQTKVKRGTLLPKVIQQAKGRAGARIQHILILASCFNTGKCCLSQTVSRNCIYALTVK